MKHTHHGKGKLWTLAAAALVAAFLTGCSSESVTQAQATDIALEHAGVTQEDTTSLSVEQDKEDGVEVYDIQFATSDRTYHYDVSRKTGEIVNYSYDAKESSQTSTESQKEDNSSSQIQAVEDAASQAEAQESAAESQTQAVEEEEARAKAMNVAMEHAGVTECYTHRIEEDVEHGRAVYEIEFFAGNTEYDYTIAKDTLEILSYDQDIEGWGLPEGETGSAVTLEQAIQLVLDRVPGAASTDVRIEYERDDGRELYEGEVHYDRTEYEFEIDASTGTFIEWSVDYQD